MLRWDFSKLSTEKFSTNHYVPEVDFLNITIETDTADIEFLPAEDCTVVCYEPEKMTHRVTVSDGELHIAVNDTRKWYDRIGIHFSTPKITVYLPQGEYGALSIQGDTGGVKIPAEYRFESMIISQKTGHINVLASADEMRLRTSTGYIRAENINTGALSLSATTGKITATGITCREGLHIKVSTGKAELTEVSCENLTSDGDTGSITLKNVIAKGQFSIERSTGDVKFDHCDAASLYVKTDTGSVTGTLLSNKMFIARTDTGRVTVPDSVSGGKCEIYTDTGSIHITVDE